MVYVFNFEQDSGLEHALAQVPTKINNIGLMDIALHSDGSLTVIVPGADSKKPGQC